MFAVSFLSQKLGVFLCSCFLKVGVGKKPALDKFKMLVIS